MAFSLEASAAPAAGASTLLSTASSSVTTASAQGPTIGLHERHSGCPERRDMSLDDMRSFKTNKVKLFAQLILDPSLEMDELPLDCPSRQRCRVRKGGNTLGAGCMGLESIVEAANRTLGHWCAMCVQETCSETNTTFWSWPQFRQRLGKLSAY